MGTAVQVAFVGALDQKPTEGLPEGELTRAYSERPSATVEAENDMLLEDVVAQAARKLDAPEWARHPHYIGLYRGEDATKAPPKWSRWLALVDDRGQVYWQWRYEGVTWGQVRAGVEAGALDGDPTRLYNVLLPQIGNGVLPDWSFVSHVLEMFKSVAEMAAYPGGIAASYKLLTRIRKKSKDSAKAVRSGSEGWRERGADPYLFDQWLDDRAWDPNDVARLLDCTEPEAEAVLWAFGFGETERGEWRRGATEDAKLMDGNRQMIIDTGIRSASYADIEFVFRQQLDVLIETGKAPPAPDWKELPWFRDAPYDPREHMGSWRQRLWRRVRRWI